MHHLQMLIGWNTETPNQLEDDILYISVNIR